MSEKEKEIQFNLQIVFNKYSIIRQIGKGSFGTVFAGINTKTNEKVAIKTEVQTDKPNLSLLESESHKLNSLRNSIGIPKIYEFGKVDGFNILVKEEIIEIESASFGKKKCKKRKKCKKAEKPRYMAIKCCLMDYDYDEFDVDDNIAKEINLKAQIFKEEGKSKEFCETQYYNKVYKNNDYKDIISYNNFFADLAKYWSENDSKRNIGFKSENILLIPNNITELIFILSILDLEEKTKKQSHNFIKDKGLGMTIEVNTNVYILTKEINETLLNTDNKYSLILAQMIFEKDKKDKNEENCYRSEVGYKNMRKIDELFEKNYNLIKNIMSREIKK